jgi:hypothetical protein
VTGLREPLELVVGPTPPDGAYASGAGQDWADELLRVIERAAAWDTGTLIEFAGPSQNFAAGFTAQSLTDDHWVVQRPLLPYESPTEPGAATRVSAVLPPDTRPVPSVAAYDQLLHRLKPPAPALTVEEASRIKGLGNAEDDD